MCGIVGYVGFRQAAPLILDALEKLEYRGYDSSGLALAGGEELTVFKAMGRLKVLRERTNGGEGLPETSGIGHTRWATHGEPSDINSHPHLSHSGKVALVHNGIIENYLELRDFLTAHGYSFVSDTDTEIVVQLVDFFYKGDPVTAARKAVNLLIGSFALGIVFKDYPNEIIAVRKDSPLIVGLGSGENFIASDVPAILSYTREVVRLNEYEFAVLTREGVTIFDRYGERVKKEPEHITWDAGAAEKGGYPHFMLKEIMEQPAVIKSTLGPRIHKGRIDLELKHITEDDLKNVDRVYIVACGSAYHVGFIAKTYIEKLVRIPVSAELASEFRYGDPLITEHTLTIVISQSGETIDTLFAMREAKKRGSRILSIVNVVGSTIAAESEEVLYTWAGPEIAVATTKAYSAQLTAIYLIALKLAELKGRMSGADIQKALEAFHKLPELAEKLLLERERIQYLASLFFDSRDIFFIGRNLDYALALEGSLKLKEISYIHSDAYAAGELKHGTISLIEKGTLVVALCTYAPLRDKMLGNIREVKARGATVLAVTTKDASAVAGAADHVIWLPKCDELVLPSLSILPLQLFAYYVALLKGCDIDKPRNLAKSVTVE
ncbi:MAG TPA: glutamine--fructose-6-phosphate transaminase (isomerizing) [Clostridia bacterium]|nr:glutamine--fructose-6-phosphate transaminase (isomerizing) [Clostridia bacterium]